MNAFEFVSGLRRWGRSAGTPRQFDIGHAISAANRECAGGWGFGLGWLSAVSDNLGLKPKTRHESAKKWRKRLRSLLGITQPATQWIARWSATDIHFLAGGTSAQLPYAISAAVLLLCHCYVAVLAQSRACGFSGWNCMQRRQIICASGLCKYI